MSWDKELDKDNPAYKIASYDGTPLRVMAGPGAGKTFAMMRRIARLLSEGVEPSKILVVTFTRTAASDLGRELSKLDIEGVKSINSGTLHAFCFKVLTQASVLDLDHRVARPLLDFEERFLLEDINNKELFGNYYQRRKHIQALAAAWAREQHDEPGVLSPTEIQFEQDLVRWLRFHEAILLSELVPLTLQYLTDNPIQAEEYMFSHVLVDEYQDLNKAEQSLIEVISSMGKLTIIGDEDQSIYEDFRYAHPEGISQFHETHLGTEDIALTQCRRCPKDVVTIANSLISRNTRRDKRTMGIFPTNEEGNIHIVQWNDLEAEAEGISKYIKAKVEANEFETGKVLILSPSRDIGYKIRDALRNLDIETHSFFTEQMLDGQPKDLESCQAQQAFTILRLLVFPDDRVALRCFLGFGHSSLRTESYLRVQEYCLEHRGSAIRDVLDQLVAKKISISKTTSVVSRYKELKKILKNLSEKSVEEVINSLFPEGNSWADPFREVISAMEIKDDTDLAKVFDAVQSHIIQPELPENVDYVRVMSLHKSKGLNANHVIVVGFIDGLIPRHPDEEYSPSHKEIFKEEQRRLFYVAITRTKHTLVLSSTAQVPRDFAYLNRLRIPRGRSKLVDTKTSTFLRELGSKKPKSIVGEKWEY